MPSVFSSLIRKYRKLCTGGYAQGASAFGLAFVSHFKVLQQDFFFVMGKALPVELSCTWTGLVGKSPEEIQRGRLFSH